MPYVDSWGQLKGVPEEQNPWAGQIRKVVEYPFMFLSMHMPIVKSILEKERTRVEDEITRIPRGYAIVGR